MRLQCCPGHCHVLQLLLPSYYAVLTQQALFITISFLVYHSVRTTYHMAQYILTIKKKHRGHTKHAIVLTPKLYNKSQTYPSPSCVVAELVCWVRGRWGGGELSSAKFKLQYFGINHTAQCECKHTHTHTQLNINMYSSIRIHIGMRK